MKKRMLALLLVLAMTVCLLPTAAMASGIVTNPDASNLPQSDGNTLRLWYDEPVGTQDWTNRSLPLGNGHIGGLTYGEIVKDRLHVNEKTLWGGKPLSDPHALDDYEFDYDALEAQRKKMDDHSTANFPVDTGSPVGMGNKSDASMGSYQDLGDIYFDFAAAGITTDVTNYVRDLDMRTAVSSVNFDLNGVHYERECLASHPDDVMASHFTASENGKISFTASLSTSSSGLKATATAEGALMYMTGTLSSSNEKWLFMAGVSAVGGTVTANEDGTITVADADEATVYVHTNTDYLPEYPTYTDGRDMETIIADGKKVVNAAMEKGYTAVRADHVADHSALFSRVEIDLGGECPTVPTDELMNAYRNGDYNHAVEEMAFQMGRYMTIAASREGDELPTNLCGIWLVGSASSYWGSDFHFNVNVQMNYWPAYTTNLAECGSVFNDFVESLVVPGRLTAAVSNGVKTEDYMNTPLGEGNGFMINTQINAWGHTWPIGSQEYGWNIGGSSWAMQNLNDYYLFTGDETYLKDTLYPMLKEMTKFWDNYLWWSDFQQRWVVGPSVSAEQGPTVNGTTYDQSLVWEVYKMAIAASEELGVDADLRTEWQSKMEGLNPIIIGEEGQVKEWFEESKTGYAKVGDLAEEKIPNFGAGGSANQGSLHRHTSQLIGLFPGTLINKDTEEWMQAAIKTLEKRTLNGTGWSRAHKLNMYARTGLSDESYQLVQNTCAGNSSGLLDNLFGSHPPYQIDCNFGLTAGMAEMLIQSQLGYTQFLPTLPTEWATGSVTGLVARGNFVVDMAWSDGTADKFTITSRNGGTFTGEYTNLAGYTVKDSDGNPVATTALGTDKISFETEAGETYTIDFEGADQLTIEKNMADLLASSMTDSRLATAKATLEKAAAEATDAETLAAANATASAAMKFLTKIDTAKSFYDEKQDVASSSAQAANALKELNDTITAAEALLNDASTTTEQFTAQEKTMSDAQTNVTTVVTLYSALLTKIDEHEAYYEENVGKGEVWNTMKSALNELSAAIAEAKELKADATASGNDFSTSMNRMSKAHTAVDSILATTNVTMDTTGGVLTMTASDDQFEIRYTMDGNEPGLSAPVYEEPVELAKKSFTIKAALYIGETLIKDGFTKAWNGGNLANLATEVTATSGRNPGNALDGNLDTNWSTNWGAALPVELVLTFEQNVTFDRAYVLGKNVWDYYFAKSVAVDYWNTETGEWVELGADPKFDSHNYEATFEFGEVTTNKVRLRVLDCQYVAYITEFEISYSKSGGLTDMTGLKEILAEAKTMQEGDAYKNGSAADQAKLDRTVTAAEAVTANEASDAASVEAATNALIEAMGPFGGVSADKAVVILDQQLTAAKELASTLTDEEDAQTLAILNGAIAAAEQVKAEAKADQYQSSATALKNAVARAKAAVQLTDTLNKVKPVYDEYAPQAGEWNAGKTAVEALADEMTAAEALLADANATKDALKAATNSLKSAADAIPGVFDSISLELALKDGKVTMTASDAQFEIRYTLDGNYPSVISKLYTAPVELPDNAPSVQAQLFLGEQAYGEVVALSMAGDNVALNKEISSSDPDWGSGYAPAMALDGNRNTRWAAQVDLPSAVIDLGKEYTVNKGAVYEDAYPRVTTLSIQVSTSAEGPWTTVYTGPTGEFDFAAVTARYVKYVTVESIGQPNISEIEIYKVASTGKPADFTKLNDVIAEAEAVKNGAYKTFAEAAKAYFDKYLQIAKDVAANENSDQETVDAAEVALRKAVSTMIVVLKINGEAKTTVDAEALTYTVSANNTQGLATATLTIEVGGEVSEPEVEMQNGWFLIAKTYADGKLHVVMANQAGVSGENDMLSITVKTNGQRGSASLAVTEAVLSAYVGDNDETFVNTIFTDAKITTEIDYSIYDVNRDGIVDQLDLTRCQRFYGKTAEDENWYAYADVNKDGAVDINDMILILNHYRK